MRLCFWPFALLLLLPCAAAAECVLPEADWCPSIRGFIDYNCDGKLRVTVIGDSVVYGRGDEVNDDKGGYVLRLREMMKARGVPMEVAAAGFPGRTAGQVMLRMQRERQRPSSGRIEDALAAADLVVIDIGRNDFWMETPVSSVVRDIARMADLAYHMTGKGYFPPVVVIARLIPNTRTNKKINGVTQQEFIAKLNIELAKMQYAKYPAVVPFDQMLPQYLETPPALAAGLHPSGAGYDVLADILNKFIRGTAQTLMESGRPDTDGDNVFDWCEKREYHTNIRSPDTDGDGYTDGQEIYILHSNPRDPNDPPAGTVVPPAPTRPPTPTPVPTPAADKTPTLTPTPVPPASARR